MLFRNSRSQIRKPAAAIAQKGPYRGLPKRPLVTLTAVVASVLIALTGLTALPAHAAEPAGTNSTVSLAQARVPSGGSATVVLGALPAGTTAVTVDIKGYGAWRETGLSLSVGGSSAKTFVMKAVMDRTIKRLTVPIPSGFNGNLTYSSTQATVFVQTTIVSHRIGVAAKALTQTKVPTGGRANLALGTLPPGTISVVLRFVGSGAWRDTSVSASIGSGGASTFVMKPGLNTKPTATLTMPIPSAYNGTLTFSSSQATVWIDTSVVGYVKWPVTKTPPPPANIAPSAAFGTSATYLAVAADGSTSSDSDGSIVGYAWTWGDGSTSTGATAGHSYSAAGTYSVTLTVTDDDGAPSQVVTRQITVTEPLTNVAPKAAFAFTTSPLAVAVNGSASTDSDGLVSGYAWTFGDGGSATGATASHAYTAAGTYSVTLTVTDSNGATGSTTQSVTVPGAAAGPAGPTNTGVPAGTALTVHNGDIVVTTPGTVLNGLDIRGMVSIKADNVTIKNSVIRGRYTSYPNALINNLSGYQNLVVTDVELAASTPSPNWSGIYGYNLTATRLNIHDVVDGIHLTGGNTVIQKSWLHNNTHYDSDPNQGGTPSHDDAIQIQVGSNIKIDGNTIRDQYSASVMITQDRGKVSNVTFTNNTADGGKCSINLAEKSYGPILGTVVSDNKFGRNTRVANCAVIAASTSTPTMARNYYMPDNAIVTVKPGA